ncbi:intermembrane phospholipid transport protein YdbH family protein [Kangiella taiwanensis]|uniref:Dicarboxylate transport domain-containing protein n=1 Tax=Kangiella taiwanensis TaxID=1079179 RepID=A0ABP8HY76_9GAMM|nr:YdbH domain-containing protein [Kangiella taiwanensis]
MQPEATHKRSWLKTTVKVLIWTILVLALALAIAYWTAPSWVPGQLQKFLPASIKLQNLEFKRPGLTSTHIDELTLILGEESPYTVTLNQVELGYSLWQRKLTSISADKAHILWPEALPSNQKSPPLEQIPLPTLPVAEMSLEQLTIEGLFLQNIVANNIKIADRENTAEVTTDVHFLDRTFNIKATATRSDKWLDTVDTNILQGNNRLQVIASPINSKHWDFDGNGLLNLTELYPSEDSHPEGVEPINVRLQGSVNLEDSVQLVLAPESQIITNINASSLGLVPNLVELLKSYYVSTNLHKLPPEYQVVVSPKEPTQITYEGDTQQLLINDGPLDLAITNPAITASASLSNVSLDLNHPLTAPMQKAEATLSMFAKNLAANFSSPEHKASTNNLNLSFSSNIKLNEASLAVSDAKGKVYLDSVSYAGKNSTAHISKNAWSVKGQSTIKLSEQGKPYHQWSLQSDIPMNSTLNLDKEQFTANAVSAKLNVTQDSKHPSGIITGNYQVADLGLKQQPLKLNDLKGSLQFITNQSPKGTLTFANARYNSQQIGVSNISGAVDWSKKDNSFVAQGALNHQQSKVPFSYTFNLKTSRHNLKIKQSSLPISTITNWVTLLKDYPQLRFSSGQLEVDSLDGDPIGLLFDGKIKLDNFNLSYDEFYVKNWTIEDSLTSNSKLGGTLKSHIEEIELATDISITDVSFLMPHTINSLVITNLKGNLLKGHIEVPQLTINDDGVSPFTAYLKAIDIGALLNALNSEKLKLTGRFDFTLPLTINKNGQQIHNGQFKALSEGVVQLKSDKGKDANIAFQALENFHYKEFSGNLNYDAKGDYVIELKVLGSNPNLYNGFPIKLDLTLRGTLPEMLYSMLISGDMTKPILDDLQQKQILNIQP